MNRSLPNNKRLPALLALVTLLLVNAPVKANWFADNDIALGIEAGSLHSGFSAKIPYSSNTSWQLTLGGGGDVNGVGLRFISQYSEWNQWRLFWHGGLATDGISAGVGADFDLSNINIPIPLSVNFTFGPKYRFGNDKGFDLFGIGAGFHYIFK